MSFPIFLLIFLTILHWTMDILTKVYSHTGLLLSFSGLHPHYREDIFRKKLIKYSLLGYFTSSIILLCFSCYKDFVERDFWDVPRQICIINPFVLIFLTHLIYLANRKSLRYLFEEIEKYHQTMYESDDKYSDIIFQYVKHSKSIETIWIIQSASTITAFPGQAVLTMSYLYLKGEENIRRMVHEMKVPFVEKYKFQSPFYEVIFLYCIGICILTYIHFTGWNIMMLLIMSYPKYQLKIIKSKLLSLFDGVNETDLDLVKIRLSNIVRHHNYTISYFEETQKTFAPFFVYIMIMTSLQICMTGLQVIEAINTQMIEPVFVIFAISSTIQVYILCRLGTDCIDASLEVHNAVYICGWEKFGNREIGNILRFIMMRAQKPLMYSAFGIIPINIMSFSAILNNAYSFLTLLRSSQD